MSKLSPQKFQRWIRDELGMKKPPSEAKLAKICKGTLANVWLQLVDNYGSQTTQKSFYNSFLIQESYLKENKVPVNSEKKEQSSNDEDFARCNDAINEYKQRLSELEREIFEVEQQIQLIHCRQALSRRTWDRFSAAAEKIAKGIEAIDERVSQYNLIESIAESGVETVNLEQCILHCSNISSAMSTVSDFVQKCMEPFTQEEFLTLLEQHMECKSIVDGQKLLLWNLQALLSDLRLKNTEYQNQLEEISLHRKDSTDDSCHENNDEKDWIEARTYGEEATERMLRNMQHQLEANSSVWISDEELEETLSQMTNIATQLESNVYSMKSTNDELENVCNDLKRTVDDSTHQKIEQLCHLSRKAVDSIKNFIKLHKEKLNDISSLEECKVPAIANHCAKTDTRMHNEDLDIDLRDYDTLGHLSSPSKQRKWHHYQNLERCGNSGSAHGLLSYVVETQVEKDLAVLGYKARNFEHEMLTDLITKEYHLTGMQQQVEQLQHYWTGEISPLVQHANSVLNNVTELLPNIRNLLDVWISQPGLVIPQSLAK
ncbi:hypothetical protein Gasu2_35960 [Galdieria sulphuraria]|nr:hypothetical protein Gasu2_35960 [Galdieria sulphuraria]